MKKRLLLLPVLAVLVYIIFAANASGPGSTSLAECTEAKGGSGCNNGSGCHGAATSTTSVSLELDSMDVAVDHYVGGLASGTYKIKISGTNSSSTSLPKFGFQLTAVKLTGAGTSSAVNGGTLATTGLPSSTHNTTVSSLHVVEHTARLSPTTGTGGSGTTYVISIPWTPPAVGTGSVKLYGSLNAINNNSASTGDKWNHNSTLITEMVVPSVGAITGITTICAGSTTTLADTTSGGTWTSGTESVATVSSTGVVTGVSSGTSIITYTVSGTAVTTTVTVNASPAAITGTMSVCEGSTVTLGETVSGGTWSSSSTSIATVSSTGVVTGVAPGTDTIKYAIGSCFVTTVVTVNPLPDAGDISGASSICIGTPISLSESVTGGSWTSSASGVASVDGSGTVSGVSAGPATISYSVTNSCGTDVATHGVTVGAAPSAGTISGTDSVCAGSTVTLGETLTGGTWGSSDETIATISSTGVVTGLSAGPVNISYTITGSCGAASTSIAFHVVGAPAVEPIISGASSVCVGASVTVADVTLGGVWSSSPEVSVTSAGVVTGVATGTGTIDYTVTGACGSSTVSYSLLVNDVPSTAGTIIGSGDVCVGTTIILDNIVLGGDWSSENPLIATVDTFGIVTGVSLGSTLITYTVSNACGSAFTTHMVTVSEAPTVGDISGASSVCTGSSITLTDPTTGGVWSSTPAASITSDGVLTGVIGGTATVSYTITNVCTSISATYSVSVLSAPSVTAITGLPNVCVGSTITLTDATAGGAYTSSDDGVATVSASGVVSGISAGAATITYTVTNSCGTVFAVFPVTVGIVPVVGTISGDATVCVGSTIALTDTADAGTWHSSATSIATVSLAGTVTGVAPGTATISYTVASSCETLAATTIITVNPLPVAGTISGPERVCIGSPVTLTASATGGVWSSASTAIATVSAAGVVTGVASGIDTIKYTMTNSCGSAVATHIDTVVTAAACAEGVANISADASFSVYPNPSNGTFTIALPQAAQSAAVTVMDLSGKVVATKSINGSNATIDLTGLASGSYIIKVNTGNNIYREKIAIW